MHKGGIFPWDVHVSKLNEMGEGCLVSRLGIVFTAIGDDYLEAVMPVDYRTRQPMGLLHGGASVALAETLGSVGAALVIDRKKEYAVGLEINTNHIRSVADGEVIGRGSPVHIGKTTHVWGIEIRNKAGRLVAVSRITLAILSHKKHGSSDGHDGLLGG